MIELTFGSSGSQGGRMKPKTALAAALLLSVSSPADASSLFDYGLGMADARVVMGNVGFNVWVHKKNPTILIEPSVGSMFAGMERQPEMFWREVAQVFVQQIDCDITNVKPILRAGAAWEATYSCPAATDLPALVHEERPDLKVGEPLHLVGQIPQSYASLFATYGQTSATHARAKTNPPVASVIADYSPPAVAERAPSSALGVLTLPLIVVEASGHILSGTTTADIPGGHFSVTDGALSCSGTYDAVNRAPEISISARCSDGRTGNISVLRESETSGHGTMILSDGTSAKFGFGSAALQLVRELAAAGNTDARGYLGSLGGPTAQSNEGHVLEVSLQPSGGTFMVPVTINNSILLDFTIDSGAADVSITADVMLTLMRTDTITKDDFIETKKYSLADGSVVNSDVYRIKSLRIGELEVHDVTVSVSKLEGSLLLGQSFLKRLKSWSIDNQRHFLIMKPMP